MVSSRTKIAFLILFLATGIWPTAAQNSGGDIGGMVTDSYGAVIPDIEVVLISVGGKQKPLISRKTRTDSNGDYSFVNVPRGIYDLQVDLKSLFLGRTFKKRIELSSKGLQKFDAVISLAPCSDEPGSNEVTELTEADHGEISRRMADILLGQTPVKEKPILDPIDFEPGWLLPEQKSRLSIMSRLSIQELTERSGEVTYYSISKPIQRGGCVAISLLGHRTVRGQMENANMAGTEENYEFRKVNGKWEGLLVSKTIS